MSIGHQIIDEIIKQNMFVVNHPDPEATHVFVWSSGAAEQLDAVVARSAEMEIKDRLIALYAHALEIAGAPDSGKRSELIAWAESVKS